MQGQIQKLMEMGMDEYSARSYLEMAGNDINMAASLYFDNGPIQPPPQPKQPAKQPPQILKDTQEKAQKSVPAPAKCEKVEPKSEPPKPKAEESKKAPPTFEKRSDNVNVFKPQHTAHEEQFNDGGVQEGGSATAVFRPKGDNFKAHVQIYRNGFKLNDTFFPTDEQTNMKALNDLLTAGKISSDIFAKTQGPKPQPNQQIELEVDEVDKDVDYDALESTTGRNFAFNENEKGNALTSTSTLKSFTANPAVKNNTQIKIAKTQQKVVIKVEAGNTFIVECDPNHTLSDILTEVKKVGGLSQVANLKNCVVIYQDKQFSDLKSAISSLSVGRFKITVQYK